MTTTPQQNIGLFLTTKGNIKLCTLDQLQARNTGYSKDGISDMQSDTVAT
jgi:hypothetical protein